MEVRPIETQYKGYRFRSRLEARWAVFFDSLSIDWEYEPEGFELDKNVRYLPDFVLKNFSFNTYGLLTTHDTYVEVKAKESLIDAKPEMFVEKTNHDMLLAVGTPAMKTYTVLRKRKPAEEVLDDGTIVENVGYGVFKKETLFMVHKEWIDDINVRRPFLTSIYTSKDIFLRFQPEVLNAVCLARSARFEYEERKAY